MAKNKYTLVTDTGSNKRTTTTSSKTSSGLNTNTSIVDYLKSQGEDSSYSARKDLAKSLGITNYSGTAEQNVQMLNALKNGTSTGSSASSAPKSSGGSSKPASSANTATPANTGTAINGVDQATLDKINSSFTASSNVTNAQGEANAYLDKVKEMASVTDIIDKSTWDAINTPFSASSAYQEAMNYTNSLLEQLSSGRTSYTDQIKDLMGQIQNREDFEYDVDSDTLFQQALASAMSSGKTAMQDTIGQASALTGGYGSTYATSAGNQAYNAYIQDAYNNLPEYYQMALEAYQMEGEEMYNQLAMLNNADATEYQRMYDSWNANFVNAQQMYAKEYGEWQDGVNNAYNSANLQLNEHGQLFEQAYNAYSAVQNNANTLYAQEYQKWADEVANAFNYAGMANSDYWNTTNFNESVRQYNESMAEQRSQFAQEMAYKNSALAQDQAQFEASLANDNAQFYASLASKSSADGSGTTEDGLKSPSETQMKKALEAYNTGGDNALYQYVDSLGTDIDMGAIDSYVNQYGQLPLEKRTFTKVKDTTNWLWGVDKNDVVKDQYGNEYKIKELPESLRKELTKLKEGGSYTAK